MEQRCNMHQQAAVDRRHVHHARHARRPQVQVRLHDTLGKPGGAAGVHDAGKVFTAPPGVLHWRSLGNQLLETRHAGRHVTVTRINQQRRTTGPGTNAFGQRSEVLIDDEDASTAIVQRIDDFRHAPADVHRIEHPAAPPHAHDVFQVAVGVQRQHANPVTGRHAEILQGARQASDPFAKFTVGVATLATDSRDVVRVLLQRALQALGHVHAVSSRPDPCRARTVRADRA
ncbi:hypothetical protein D3C84_198020 [compost metagenome]